MITKFIYVNIRIDLLLIAPLMIAMAVKTTKRWELAAGSTVPPASGLSTASYIAGLCSILLYQWLIFSLAAVAFGHAAQVLATRRGGSAVKTRYIAGLLMGYITLSLAVIGYDNIYSFLVVRRLLYDWLSLAVIGYGNIYEWH
jgi:magnesium-transporting ATPase (P-type)